ncbi:MAG: DciA family protein [Terriglobales bacterium]
MERAVTGLKKIVLDAIRQSRHGDAPLLAWPVIVGRAIAAQTKALEFTDGVLRVQVPDKNWRAELSPFVPQYIAAYQSVAKVDSIEFVIDGERSRRKPDSQ